MTRALTLTYGDPDSRVRDTIGSSLSVYLSMNGATLWCDRFNGHGEWTDDTGTTYVEYSGVIVADVSDLQVSLDQVRAFVSRVAETTGQDAIGFMVAPFSKLIAPGVRDASTVNNTEEVTS